MEVPVVVQYCKCAGVNALLELKKIVISNGPFQQTVLYCCEECYDKYFAETADGAFVQS